MIVQPDSSNDGVDTRNDDIIFTIRKLPPSPSSSARLESKEDNSSSANVTCAKTAFRDDSTTEDSLENNSDVEVVLDYENFQNGVVEKSKFDDHNNVGVVGIKTVSEYYEEMIFSTGKKSISETDTLEISDTYEDVVQKDTTPKYENVIFDKSNKKLEEESLYTVGRRFPSIRSVKSKNRKEAKKDLYAKPDKGIMNKSNESGSFPRPVAAIYAPTTNDFQSKLDLGLDGGPESNIYENERIILGKYKKPIWWPVVGMRRFKKPKTSHVLIAVMIISVIVFLSAGAILIYKPMRGSNTYPSSLFKRPPQKPPSLFEDPSRRQEEVRKPRSGISWSTWSSWSQCSFECLPGESQARTRTCENHSKRIPVDIKLCLAQGSANSELRVCPCSSIQRRITTTTEKENIEENVEESTGKYYFKF